MWWCVFIQGLRNLFACCRVVDVEMRGSERPRGKLKGIKGSHGGFLTIYIDSCKQCRGSWSTLDSAALWLRTHTVKNREKKRLYGRTKIHQLLCDIIFCQIKELNTFKNTLFHIFSMVRGAFGSICRRYNYYEKIMTINKKKVNFWWLRIQHWNSMAKLSLLTS